ncbi:MAG: XRE family transcriptional regulator [Clostridia bacterium]|nr:XRE family transcriptional regulator [Clostridia bacterium]
MYYLKLFNETLITFDMNRNLGLEIKNINIITEDRTKYPIILQNTINEKTITEFLQTRIIPKNRGFVEQILTSVGLNINDTKGIIDICKGLSLNDCYWIVQDETLKFEDYNLYDNEFSETLSLVAFTGYTTKVKGIITSPELTTNGFLPKAWRRIDGEIYLYKGSTERLHYSNTGLEPYSEYYAYQIAEKMEIDSVKYDLNRWKDDLVSICKLFTSKEYSYIPIYQILPNTTLREVASFMKQNHFEEEFGDLILLDALIMNYDRHFGNFGVLKNNYTGIITKLAPIFDNGEGLLSKVDKKIFEDSKTFDEFINSENANISYYGISFDELVSNFCNKTHISKLRKLLTFEFTKHPNYNLDEQRLKLLEKMVKDRAKRFIKIIEKSK